VTVTAATVAAVALATSPATGATSTGPSTTTAPYVLPVAAGVDVTSLLTVGDDGAAGNGYEMVGIPDGLGVLEQGANRIVYMNHELSNTVGAVRAHGERGAFVSRLVVDPETGRVKEGSDWIQDVVYYDYSDGSWSEDAVAPAGAAAGTHTNAFSRFCSGALTQPGQLFDAGTKSGFKGQVYFANEESGDEGRVFGVLKGGTAYQLPRLGLFSWENTLAAHTTTDRTVVMGNEDGGNGQLRVYNGTKQRNGTAVDKAGLTDGTLHVVKVEGITDLTTATARAAAGLTKGVSKPFTVPQIDWTKSGAAQNVEADAKGTRLNRIEDGSFDPQHPNDYYFLTTEGGVGAAVPTGATGRDGGSLWRLRFTDVNRPELGGTLTLMLDGSESIGLNKPDNMTITGDGNMLIQEDPGNNEHVARIVGYRISDGALGTVARCDASKFVTGAPGFITRDEESSGIVELEDGSFLFDAQVHKASGDPATVELGQLLHMTIDDWAAVYAG
jgi:hypothetical protein